MTQNGWRVQYSDGSPVFVGHEILFDHFGSKNRPGRVVKITANAVHVEWTAPASGITRIVKLSTKTYAVRHPDAKVADDGHIHYAGFSVKADSNEWSSKNPRRAQEAQERAAYAAFDADESPDPLASDFNPDACPECENDPISICRACGREAK